MRRIPAGENPWGLFGWKPPKRSRPEKAPSEDPSRDTLGIHPSQDAFGEIARADSGRYIPAESWGDAEPKGTSDNPKIGDPPGLKTHRRHGRTAAASFQPRVGGDFVPVEQLPDGGRTPEEELLYREEMGADNGEGDDYISDYPQVPVDSVPEEGRRPGVHSLPEAKPSGDGLRGEQEIKPAAIEPGKDHGAVTGGDRAARSESLLESGWIHSEHNDDSSPYNVPTVGMGKEVVMEFGGYKDRGRREGVKQSGKSKRLRAELELRAKKSAARERVYNEFMARKRKEEDTIKAEIQKRDQEIDAASMRQMGAIIGNVPPHELRFVYDAEIKRLARARGKKPPRTPAKT
ncbi:MAG: hypothetical protein UY92_C0003G0006 [Candidatus Magasanikbacteria bacterium GW2011_GWA2_56_11]|uniref:Uncharacterized protein n=1 Tax=Candidatus Magasanikbacteria bacterium GW2011_GWA2_56_11 TaxID=1619044 RepID=A0A0G1YHW8_9BACT|nr:MAG: hypothetical protein UY92_C0003G0006 [Candidatus Magasanikbacteria bacterium GW2011_GWA2_56_11]